MTSDPQREPETIPHVDGPQDPTPADVPRGEAEVPKTDEPGTDASAVPLLGS